MIMTSFTARRRARVVPAERRRSPRYPASDAPAQVGWWDGPEFLSQPARLIDVGAGGAQVEVESVPLRGQPIWVCMAGGSPGGWVEAGVVGSR
jgi:hypothetical protein